MKARLVNGRSGDPALLLELPQQSRAILFDAGELGALDNRTLLNTTHLFLSHGHMDHVMGLDRLLRALVGQEREVAVFGPPGTIANIGHKLRGYEWDLVDGIAPVLGFTIRELHGETLRGARCVLQRRFEPEPMPDASAPGGVLLDAPWLRVRASVLRHHGPVLAFRAEAPPAAAVDAAAIAARGWVVGPWVAAMKRSLLAGAAVLDTPAGALPVASLSDVVRIEPGASLGYVTDVADDAANRAGVVALVRGVDTLFIEAPFPAAEAERAFSRGHLTAKAAGELGRLADVGSIEPFHLSIRHDAAAILSEVARAFDLAESEK